MEFLLLVTQSVLPIFLILGIANIYYRAFKPDIKQLVDISIYIFSPAVVFHALVKDSIGFSELGRYLLLMVLVTAALMLLGRIVGAAMRLPKSQLSLFILSVSMINIGNFGVPLIYFTYGEAGVYDSLITFVAFNIPLVTIAVYMASGEASIKANLKNVAKIPIFHASLAALLLNTFSIPVPETFMKLAGFLGSATFPFIIFILGLQLTTIRLNKSIVKGALASVILKLGAAPFIAAGVLSVMGFSGMSYSVALIQISGPSALLPLMYAIKFGKNSDLLAAAILLSTALAAVSLPIVIYFAG